MGDDTQDGTEREGLDTEAIAARVEAATPGPWDVEWKGYGELTTDYRSSAGFKEIVRMEGRDSWSGCDHRLRADEADADFIAHARQDIPALLAALGRAEAERDEARQIRDEVLVMADRAVTAAEARLAAAEAVVEAAERLRAKLADYTGFAMREYVNLGAALATYRKTTGSQQEAK